MDLISGKNEKEKIIVFGSEIPGNWMGHRKPKTRRKQKLSHDSTQIIWRG
jgi:hypothetical protein